jgi:hypothetical protein
MIYAGGCRKRGREKEAQYYEDLAAKYEMAADNESGSRNIKRTQSTQ